MWLCGYCAIGYVSIPQWCDCCSLKSPKSSALTLSFNPTMVRLLHGRRSDKRECEHGFNPTMVRLLLCRELLGLDEMRGFNSTMVRLLRSTYQRFRQRCSVSIPQWCDCCVKNIQKKSPDPNCFNPTMVRLLHGVGVVAALAQDSFNPTMVRLLHAKSFALLN